MGKTNWKPCTGLLVAALATANIHAAIVETGDVTDNGTTTLVGDTGVGTYTVDGGSDAVEGTMRFGETPTGDGTGLVTGAGSSLEIDNGVLNVGNNGTGLFTIADGGAVSITRDAGAGGMQGGFIIAQPVGSVGELVVTSAGSSLTGVGNRILMGGEGRAIFTVEDNATVDAFGTAITNPLFIVAQRPSGRGTINVRTGGLLDLTGPGDDEIFLGERGSGTLNIESGGRMIVGELEAAQRETATADINLDGVGSELQINDRFYFGRLGVATLDASDGSLLEVGVDLFVGGEIGAESGDGTMTVTGGSTVTVADDLYVSTDLSTGKLSVSGDGSTLTINDRFWVAWGTTSSPADGTLEVGRGAFISAPGNGPSSSSGLAFAVASNDTATMRFIIGDDGTGSIESGLIETGAFLFGSGTALLDIGVDSGVVLNPGDTFVLIDYDATNGGRFANANDDTLVSLGGYQFLIDYDTDLGGGDLALTATVIPEPTSLALLGLGGLLLARRRR